MLRIDAAFARGVIGALLAGTVLLVGAHMWNDHALLHEAVAVMNQQLREYPLKAVPPVGPPPQPAAPATPPAALGK